MPNPCPVCAAPLEVTRLDCPSCETRIEGHFSPGPFANLTPDQLDFVLLFVRLEGKLRSMEAELGLSYPTIRARLHDIIRALGHQPGDRESPPTLSADDRRHILADLEAGLLDATEALERLQP